jgi:hypothetical protein
MSERRAWGSLHIYHHADHDALLVGCVAPLSRWFKSEGLASLVFYLRYWRGGPHVRLRFLAPDPVAREAALAVAHVSVTDHLRLYPSDRALDPKAFRAVERQFAELEGEPIEDAPLRPDNSCWIEPYEPELAKYGGVRGAAIAEVLFDASTSVALPLLEQAIVSPGKRLGHAFCMLLAGSIAFGVPIDELPAFFASYHRMWARYVHASAAGDWGTRLAENRDRLAEHARPLLEGKPSPQTSVRAWQEAMTNAGAAVRTKAILDEVRAPIPAEHKHLFLLVNYLHTHNNRLGVTTAEEAYLGFLVQHVVEDLV